MHDPAKKRASRRKGAAEERALVRFLQQRGFAAEKVSRTGYRGPDLSVPLLGVDRAVEVKARGNGFATLYRWLGSADLLIVRANRREPLVVIPLWLASEIAAEAEGHAGPTQRQLAALTKKQERGRIAATPEEHDHA
jgi:Holliday junction resolvase